jgi:hypothetical protein
MLTCFVVTLWVGLVALYVAVGLLIRICKHDHDHLIDVTETQERIASRVNELERKDEEDDGLDGGVLS